MTPVRDRDVHAIPTPRLGGIAMLGGFGAGLLVATQLPFLGPRLGDGQQTAALLAGAVLICLLGVADDKWELDALTKLAGQVLAAGVMVHRRRADALPADRRSRRRRRRRAAELVRARPGRGDGAHHRPDRRHGQRGQLRRRPRRARRRHRRDRRRGVLRLLLPARRDREPDPRDPAGRRHRGSGRGVRRLPAAQLQPGPHLHGRLRLDAHRAAAGLDHHHPDRHGRPPTRSTPTWRPRCCRCCCRSRCWRCRSSTCCSPSSGAPSPAGRRSRRTSSTCTTGCSSSATATRARSWSCTCGPR